MVDIDAKTDRAPDYGPGDWPSSGTRIGPAWQFMWQRLADGEWHMGVDLASDPAVPGGLLVETLRKMLGKAAHAGAIERQTVRVRARLRYGKFGPATRVFYRRPVCTCADSVRRLAGVCPALDSREGASCPLRRSGPTC